MPSPRALRLQDRRTALLAREQQLQAREAAGQGNVNRLNRREYRVGNRIAMNQFRTDQLGAQNTADQLQNRINFLNARQYNNNDFLASGSAHPGRTTHLQRQNALIDTRRTRAQNTLSQFQSPPPAPTPPAPGPTYPDTGSSGNGSGGGGSFADLLKQYETPQTDAGNATNNFYTQSLARLNLGQQPSFQDQYQRYLNVADQEAARQSAAINESFGARGARYGSDLLDAQGQLRKQMLAQNATAADQVNANLNTQQNQSLQALGSLYNTQGPLDQQRDQTAQKYLFSDYLARRQPSQVLAGSAQYASSFGGPTTVVG